MIGELKHPDGWTARLSKDGEWTSTDNQVTKALNSAFSPRKDYSPAQGAYGYHHLHKAAKILGAEVANLSEPPQGEEGTVY